MLQKGLLFNLSNLIELYTFELKLDGQVKKHD